MGHLTLKMIGILTASLAVFGLAQAENRAEKNNDETSELESSSSEELSKEKKAAERFRAQQSIQRAFRDQGMPHGPVKPVAPPAKKK